MAKFIREISPETSTTPNFFLAKTASALLPLTLAVGMALASAPALSATEQQLASGGTLLWVADGEAGDLSGLVVDVPADYSTASSVYGAVVWNEAGYAVNGAFDNTVTFGGQASQAIAALAGAASGNTLVLTGTAKLTNAEDARYDVYAVGGLAESNGTDSSDPYMQASQNIVAVGVDALARSADGSGFTYDAGEGTGGAYVDGTVIGGYNAGRSDIASGTANAVGNSVLIYKSEVTGNVVGGAVRVYDDAYESRVDGNQVVLVDATVGGQVIGGVRIQAEGGASNAPWDIEPAVRSTESQNAIAASGVNKVGGLYAGTYNTLSLTLGEENMNQAVITSATDLDISGVALTINGGTNTTNGMLLAVEKADGTSGVISAASGATISYHGGLVEKTWQLADGFEAAEQISIQSGELADAEGVISAEAVQLVGKTLNQSAGKLFSEAAAGTAALVADNADFMAGRGIAAAKDAAKSGPAAFAAVYGGSSRYITGSHVTLNSGSIAAGYATVISGGTSTATVAPYAEAGWGTSESKAGRLRAEGDHAFYGVGIAAAWEHDSGLHAEVILRGGYAETKNRADFETDSADYKTEASYVGASVGAGFVWTALDGVSIDPYFRYSWTRIGSDSVELGNVDADRLELDALSVGTFSTGVMVEAVMSREVTTRFGAAYQRVVAGDASGRISGLELDAPSLEGNRGVLELGLTVKPADSDIALDLGISGYCGDREGVSGSATLKYKF